jgi:REP element-mobilizing transposase RayT
VHMLISIPPKYAVSQVVGFINSNSHFDLEMGFGPVGRPAQSWHGD